jgi:histidyl-tRNA synthetase
MFLNNGEKETRLASGVMQELRERNISCELYHENSKVDKQFKYAEKKNIPFVITLNADEKTARIKDIRNGKLEILPLASLLTFNF